MIFEGKMEEVVPIKKCFKCELEKPLTDFYKHAQMADGHLNKCKDCAKTDVSQNYRARFYQYQAYEKRRLRNPLRRGRKLAYERQHRLLNPEKYRARNAVSNALRDGRLARLPCESCGTAEKVQAHHEDYSRPLDVRWLCGTCHHKEHGHLEHLQQTEAA